MAKKNPLAFFTRAEIEFFERPFFTGSRWIGFDDEKERVLLTRSRCKQLGFPVQNSEEPIAYRYAVDGPADRKYVQVFDRTGCNIDRSKLYPKEIYPFKK